MNTSTNVQCISPLLKRHYRIPRYHLGSSIKGRCFLGKHNNNRETDGWWYNIASVFSARDILTWRLRPFPPGRNRLWRLSTDSNCFMRTASVLSIFQVLPDVDICSMQNSKSVRDFLHIYLYCYVFLKSTLLSCLSFSVYFLLCFYVINVVSNELLNELPDWSHIVTRRLWIIERLFWRTEGPRESTYPWSNCL